VIVNAYAISPDNPGEHTVEITCDRVVFEKIICDYRAPRHENGILYLAEEVLSTPNKTVA